VARPNWAMRANGNVNLIRLDEGTERNMTAW
jgi:hypothetical protein